MERAPWPYRVVVVILRCIVTALRWRVDVAGGEHIPDTGPVIVVANHVSYLDPILLGLAIDRRGRVVRYLAKRELFDHWFTGPVMRGTDQIRVDRRGNAGGALLHAELAMLDNKLLVVFPEATIHARLDPGNGKTGSARLALATGAPLIPAVSWGGQFVATKGARFRPRAGSPHTVRFGEPIAYSTDDSVEDLTATIMSSIAVLLESAAADHPADLGPPTVRT